MPHLTIPDLACSPGDRSFAVRPPDFTVDEEELEILPRTWLAADSDQARPMISSLRAVSSNPSCRENVYRVCRSPPPSSFLSAWRWGVASATPATKWRAGSRTALSISSHLTRYPHLSIPKGYPPPSSGIRWGE